MATDLIGNVVSRLLQIPARLEVVVTAYLLALMLDGPKKTLSRAAAVSGLHKAQFSRLLSNHAGLAIASLQALAVEAARRAEGYLAGGATPSLRRRVEEVLRDVKMVLRIEEIWLPRA